ncbi:predicted protein [Chaetomium globosum CBS 148.51]|uniref:Uncharacterized protein n=1 Tax=Chaetomium globosum (strain ATCC 6205 / CBS 148.51 / DSM 1962 / NBRC 6347 / NRRL 1970) TaxID=306901 RepID=Q2HG81_CHAGB|nr:uncharacterized protein CHGG_00773 [Chaetomium globosum CBS 148.51]EAQ92538.1 predicted protein [Chaetomium globosum CBS 148.51]
MSAPPVPVSANQGDAPRPREPSTLYKATPGRGGLGYHSLRHSIPVARLTAETPPTTNTNRHRTRRVLRPWLHRVVYRYQPYRYANSSTRPAAEPGNSPGGARGASDGGGGGAGEYYHSKQRELMRMEAEEAFEMRSVVVVGLGLVSVVVEWMVWRVVGWMVGVVGGLVL